MSSSPQPPRGPATGAAGYRVAVVGATGAVGQRMCALLAERGFPVSALVPFASVRSHDRVLGGTGPWAHTRIIGLGPDTDRAQVRGFDLAIFSAGSAVSREWAPRFADAGAYVVDNSSFWRANRDVPLVVTEVNSSALDCIPRRIVANPNCVAMACLLPLKALHERWGLEAVVATSFQAAGGAGASGMNALHAEIPYVGHLPERLVESGVEALRESRVRRPPAVHRDTLAFNVVPLLGARRGERGDFAEHHNGDGGDPSLDALIEAGVNVYGYTDEELKLVSECRKVLQLPHLAMSPTCVRVPTVVGHAIELRARFADVVSAAEAVRVMNAFPGVEVADCPTPLHAAGRDEVLVGRVRRDLADDQALNLFVVGDNLRKGAALNAVQIAEALHARGVLGR